MNSVICLLKPGVNDVVPPLLEKYTAVAWHTQLASPSDQRLCRGILSMTDVGWNRLVNNTPI
ncbi:hypothetical protein CY34DRAFT_810606 [Suillus luteus UH-Slu-Lm8-n1]|uniref:Uncharacterized protein n=1 Tax=Suillus luteus UH-Slu-Lm8-n1 TaxID=930992 RepID=A0A0D0A6E5_9AGAM|nr:hypothetical protein CY34DRAFT_810606 [Suillus luteus UH-Slu-Lm8-n1]